MAHSRYLGSGYNVRDLPDLTGQIPAHLPGRLAISLWDFSWYTRAGQEDPFNDLRAVFEQLLERGYNAIRICAAPGLIYGPEVMAEMGLVVPEGFQGLARELIIDGLGVAPDGERYGRGTRWYESTSTFSVDVHARLIQLCELAQEFGISIVIASWEYQQSTAFAQEPTWFRALESVPLERRYEFMARCLSGLVKELQGRELLDTVAFVELHNEIDFSILPGPGVGMEEAISLFSEHFPNVMVTCSWGKPPHLSMFDLPPYLQVSQHHVYSYGVLDALQQLIDIRSEGTKGFPNDVLRTLLREGAPTPGDYGKPAAWKLEATVVTDQMIYGYDWIDLDRWDAWLFENYKQYETAMVREIESRVTAIARWARHCNVPAVIGEGWVGYTPLHASFEESRVGFELALAGIERAKSLGIWGMVPTSNAAPHHSLWLDIEWQRDLNRAILA